MKTKLQTFVSAVLGLMLAVMCAAVPSSAISYEDMLEKTLQSGSSMMFYMDPITISAGSSTTVNVLVQNPVAMINIENVTLNMPDGVTVTSVSDSSPVFNGSVESSVSGNKLTFSIHSPGTVNASNPIALSFNINVAAGTAVGYKQITWATASIVTNSPSGDRIIPTFIYGRIQVTAGGAVGTTTTTKTTTTTTRPTTTTTKPTTTTTKPTTTTTTKPTTTTTTTTTTKTTTPTPTTTPPVTTPANREVVIQQPSQSQLYVGNSFKLNYSSTYGALMGTPWSENTNVANINSDGIITISGTGTVTLHIPFHSPDWSYQEEKTVTFTVPDNSTPVSYELGDVDRSGGVDAVDASAVLTEYARLSTNKPSGFDSEQKILADVDESGGIDSVDASAILSYYAYVSTGGSATKGIKAWLAERR